MNKDVIYIDVEDDITAIISKVKSSKEKIIALVPPKRVGLLQSAVNLRLLDRAARQGDKRLVLITNNQALTSLAAAAKIPIAKNLQSKPELPEITALEIDDNEIIDGAQLPVGELEKTSPKPTDEAPIEALLGAVAIDEGKPAAKTVKVPVKAAGKKVPNFNTFRKKLFIGGALLLVLAGVLIWAFVFAPRATVVITAKTTPVPVNGVVQLTSETNAEKGTLKVRTETLQKDESVEFDATGEKNVGEKATGTVRFSTGSIANYGLTIPSGTAVRSSSGLTFYTTQAITFTLSNYGGADAGVVAAESGENYNGATGAVSGAPSGVSASFVGATSGGTSKIVKVVTAADVQAAKEKLVALPTSTAETELKGRFGDTDIVIDGSFVTDRAEAVASPAVNEEAANGKATLTSKGTYKLSGVAESSIDDYVTQALKQQMQDQTTQKVYSTGADSATLTDYQSAGTARLSATGQIGPVIDEEAIKQEVAGKRYGTIREELTSIDGISDVEVKFPYFWVRTVPTDTRKITIEFTVENA